MTKELDNMQEILFDSTLTAGDSGNEFLKNIFKTFLGKLFYENRQAKHAVHIYNEQVTYFANKK